MTCTPLFQIFHDNVVELFYTFICRLHKQELASLAQSAQEVLQQVEEAAKMEHNNSGKSVEQLPKQQVQRQKIVISIQDKEGQKQFRIYTV